MPEYLAPGVYVEEVDTGSKPIEGVSTSTTGMIGVTERGPVNVPILVTSNGEFVRWFGERLNMSAFSNGPNDRHCYLPHAVQGFFENGGKRLYITRILDTANAARSSAFQFEHEAGATETLLLRSAGEATGSAANPPALIVLSGAGLANLDWVRVGDGSRAEYRQVAGAPVNDASLVPLGAPLNRSYPNGFAVNAYVVATTGGAVNPVAAVARGADTIVVEGADPDINALDVGEIIRIGGANGEFRVIVDPPPVPARPPGGQLRAVVRLDSPLAMPYTTAADVELIDLAAGTAADDTVDTPYIAGEPLVFLASNAGFIGGDLLVMRDATPSSVEARPIGALRLFSLSGGAPDGYPAGTLIEQVVVADDARAIAPAGAAAGATTVPLTAAPAGLVVGQRVLIAEGGNQQPLTVRALGPGNQITVAPALANAYTAAGTVSPRAKGLTADAAAGATSLALDDRLGIAADTVLRVTDGLNEEWVTVVTVPGRAPVAPDAGLVQITPPLARAYPDTAEAFIQGAVTPGGAQVTYAVLAAPAGAAQVLVADGRNYAQNDMLRLTAAGAVTFHRLTNDPTIAAATPTPQQVTLDRALLNNHGAGTVLAERQQLFLVQALDAGAWGDRLLISIEDEETGLVGGTTLVAFGPATRIRLASNAGVEPGTILEVISPLDGQVVPGLLKVQQVDRATGNITLAGAGLTADHDAARVAAAPRPLILRSREFRLTVRLLRQPDPAMPSRNDTIIDSEVFRHLSMDSRHSRYLQRIIGDIGGALRPSDRRPEGESWYIRVHDLAQDIANATNRLNELTSTRLGPETLVDILPDGRMRAAQHPLFGGFDSINSLVDATYVGQDNPTPELRTGLQTLRNIEQISLVGCPGRTGVEIQGALITHCELLRYRFAALDGPQPPNDLLPDVQTLRSRYDSKYASIYHPWLIVPDPYPTNLANVAEYAIPPSGHVLGLIARIDIERGVHKPPANEVLRGITGLQRLLNKEQQDILNPSPVNVNLIRDFRPNNRGIRVFGARVITSDPDWKYVNVRRLLIFIEASIDRGLQWVVFEPNAPPLWARVQRSIAAFLTTVWRNGALEGRKVEDAFFVKCDETTMTQADIDNGRLIVIVGVAPVKPAEYVIIRIGLWTARAEE